MQSVQIVEIEEHKQIAQGISVYMIEVQIYYTVYNRRTRVLYAVAVAVAEYAVWYTGLCCGIYNTMLWYIQYYAV